MRKRMKRDPYVIGRRVELLDLMAENPDGLTRDDIYEVLSWTPNVFSQALKSLRGWLATDGDNLYTLVCSPDPNTWQGQWIYRLVPTNAPKGSQEGEVLKFWISNQFSHDVTRLGTIRDTYAVKVRGTDGRTAEGKVNRSVFKHLTRCLEDVAEIMEEAGIKEDNTLVANGVS